MTRFGVPKVLILDNGLQFDNKALLQYYIELVVNRYSTLSYPQSNG